LSTRISQLVGRTTNRLNLRERYGLNVAPIALGISAQLGLSPDAALMAVTVSGITGGLACHFPRW
jgi:hypothetical protein